MMNTTKNGLYKRRDDCFRINLMVIFHGKKGVLSFATNKYAKI